MVAGEGSKEYLMNQRTSIRLPWQKECILFNQFGLIKAKTVDISLIGLGVKTDSTLPLKFKNGCKLTAFVSGVEFTQSEIMWTKKNFNNTTTLGLKFQLAK